MSFLRKSFLGLLAVSGLIWFIHKLIQTTQHQVYHQTGKVFDSQLTNIHWIEFNEEGKIVQELFSPKVRSDSKDNQYHIHHPFLKLMQGDEYWEIKSHMADASQNVDAIELKKHVFIKHTTPKNPNASIMQTEHLLYLTKLKKAQTEDLVTITLGESILHSQGLEVFFDEARKIKLQTVSGHYQPNTKL